MPDVFLRQKKNLIPKPNRSGQIQSKTDTELYKLGNNSSASIAFKASTHPIQAIEAAISLNACAGKLTMTIRKTKDGLPITAVSIDAKQINPGQLWQWFNLSKPLNLEKGKEYFIRFDFEGFGRPDWFGIEDEREQAGAFYQNREIQPSKWAFKPNNAPAYAVDDGNLRHQQQNEPYEIYCDWDQIDGQANVIMAWARLAEKRGLTAFEDRTYPLVAKLMDRTSDQPYFMSGQGFAVGVNLVQNIALEHSREGRYWQAWDILTQCVVGASLESMLNIARRRGDIKHLLRWQDRLQILKNGVAKNLTRIVDGKKVYLEMRLPNSAGGVPFLGMGWLNFAPVMAQWEPLERQVLRNTIELLREKLLLDYQGKKYLAMEYDPDGTVHKDWIIGKGVGWEIEYARQEKEYDRIIEWFNFLKSYHTGNLYSEFMRIDDSGKWITGDGGNGEQCTWWCWAIARLRKEAGLPVVPKRQ